MHLDSAQAYSDILSNWNGRDPLSTSFRNYLPEFVALGHENLRKWTSNDNCRSPKIQVIDMFSGAGGMSLGFSALCAGDPLFGVVGGLDLNKDACTTYETNFRVPGFNRDILDLFFEDAPFQDFIDSMEYYDPAKPTIVIGCPPCQGFTSHRKKNWHIEDERNTLVGVFAEVAMRFNPICVVLENVPEMLSSKYWHHYEAANSIFEQYGYTVKQTIVNSAEHGVPQERFRTIMLAFRKDFLLPHPLLTNRDDFLTVRQAIGDLPPVKPGQLLSADPMHKSANHRKSTIETIKAVPKDGGKRPAGVGPKCLDKINGFSDVYGRLYWDKPAITLTRYARNPASGRYVHPEQNRGLTMREAALLQSFPTGFVFTGSFDSVFKQIGEAVPPKLAVSVAATVLTELVSPEPTSSEKASSTVVNIIEPVSNSFSSVIAGLKNEVREG